MLELTIQDDRFDFCSTISTALKQAQSELQSISETIDSLKGLTPECDKLDYILAASFGTLCGILDIFLVGKPGESPIGNISDKWFAERTMDFAKCCGWKGRGENQKLTQICFHVTDLLSFAPLPFLCNLADIPTGLSVSFSMLHMS